MMRIFAEERRLDDQTELARLTRLFHEASHRAARNPYLDTASQELHDAIALLGITTLSVAGRSRDAAEEHRAILKAIEKRDADSAEHLARAYPRSPTHEARDSERDTPPANKPLADKRRVRIRAVETGFIHPSRIWNRFKESDNLRFQPETPRRRGQVEEALP